MKDPDDSSLPMDRNPSGDNGEGVSDEGTISRRMRRILAENDLSQPELTSDTGDQPATTNDILNPEKSSNDEQPGPDQIPSPNYGMEPGKSVGWQPEPEGPLPAHLTPGSHPVDPTQAGITPPGQPVFTQGETIPDAQHSSAGFEENKMPPEPVEEIDMESTLVTPTTFSTADEPLESRWQRSSATAPMHTRPSSMVKTRDSKPVAQPSTRSRKGKQRNRTSSLIANRGCIWKLLLTLVFMLVIISLAAVSVVIIQYFAIARTLPNVSELKNRASQFETTRIMDREGNLLYEILDPNAGRRTYVKLDEISPYLIAATIATEDKDYYNHPGYDPFAIARALIQNYTSGEVVSGASTITQQLARMLLLSPEERYEKTVQRKAREIVLAAEITRKYSKDEILELYLNESYYGNLAYGIEAAAETYFQTTARQLTLSQGSFLAGLPQAPAVYDIFTNREETLNRHKQVLVLMYQLSGEKGCIEVLSNVKPVCVDAPEAQNAAREMENYPFQMAQQEIRFPHWVMYIRSLLEQQYDAQTIYRSGFTVYTTLDPRLQQAAEQIVINQVEQHADRQMSDGALVAIQPSSGEILAMVGSAGFYNEEIDGQVNMAIAPRQPGSSIKPLTYTAAFEKGWTPATLIWDVPSEFPPSGIPNDPAPPYIPVNYDGRFHGPVTVRSALANSYNVPAVKTLQFVGIYDDPSTPEEEGFIKFAERLGITTLTRNDYGLALTLGGGEVSLLELTGAFATFANSGIRVPPVAITRIEDFSGNVIFETGPPAAEQVIRPEHAYLITSILSDNDARTPMFGAASVLNLPFRAAAKTGTTNDFRDNWTLGYTPNLAVGVWVGNADNSPMVNTTGLSGAAPIWAEFMQFAIPLITGNNPAPFNRPERVVDKVICAVSGTEPSEWCPTQRSEIFAYDQLPLPSKDDLWHKVSIDTWTDLKASPYCSDTVKEEFAINVDDSWAQKWIKETEEGKNWAKSNGFEEPFFFPPEHECGTNGPKATIHFAGLNEGQTIVSGPLDIYAVVFASSNFKDYNLEYGVGDDPGDWHILLEGATMQYQQPERLFTWDIKDIPSGRVTLRIYMNSTDEKYAEKRLHLNFNLPTPTPTITPTATLEPTNTAIPTETQTPTPTETP